MTKMRRCAFVAPLALGLASIVPATGGTHAAAATSGLSYHFGSPPIASAGSIGPGQSVTFNLRVQNNGQPDPGGIAYIGYSQGGHVAGDKTTVVCNGQPTVLVTTGTMPCMSDSNGVIPFTYQVPLQPPAQGRADWVAKPSPTSMVNSGTTHYVYCTVYRFSPSPLLSSGQVTLSAKDGLNHGIPQNTVYLSFKGTGSATAAGKPLTVAPTLFTTDGSGLLQIAYTAGSGDVIKVQDLAQGPTEVNTDSSASASTPVVSVGDVTVVEGDQHPGIPAEFTVSITPVQSTATTVQFVTLCGIGDKGCGEDFIQVGSPTTVTIPANASSTTVLVRQFAYIGGNSGETFNEGYYVQVLNPSVGVVGRSIGNGMLLPDVENSSTALALLYTGSAAAVPVPDAAVPLYFTVTLGAAENSPVSFDYATSDGSASGLTDYGPMSGKATIAAGQTSTVIQVLMRASTPPASDRSFSLTITNSSGPMISTATGTGTLLTADAVPTGSSGPAAYMNQVYLDTLGRPMDAAGAAYWVPQVQPGGGAQDQRIAAAFTSTTEYRYRMVDQIYLRYLGHPPDSAGQAYWSQQIANGLTYEQLRAFILSSAEYFAISGGSNSGFVANVYSEVLQRAPSAGEQAYWQGQLGAGAARSTVAYAILTSDEGYANYIDRDVYQPFLRRSADQAAYSFWIPALRNGLRDEAFVANILGSAEYYAYASTH